MSTQTEQASSCGELATGAGRRTKGSNERRSSVLVWAIVAAILVLGAWPSLATHSGAHPALLSRGSFTDEVDMQLRVKLDGRATRVINVDEPSDVVTARIAVDDNGVIPWHTHPGPVIVTVQSGELTYVNASDCVERVYPAGTAFIDPGQGNVHMAYASAPDTVLVATFLGVDGPLTVAASGPADCNPGT